MSPAMPSPIERPIASQYLLQVDHTASDTGTFAIWLPAP
jgi:hypothetical protein